MTDRAHRPVCRPTLLLAVALALAAGLVFRPATAPAADPDPATFFEAEVRPLLAQNCVKCHGPSKQKGGLRLDSREGVLTGGESGPAVVPGQCGESLLVEAIDYEGLQMPPNGQLAERQREALKRWIEMGAPWPDRAVITGPGPKISPEARAFWSFLPVERPAVPNAREGWARNPIDAFILTKLRAEGLDPAPEADRRTLIRRVTFDLTGLPPTPEEVEAFVADPAPDAYERLVDRLLASPHHGERWARHWLDIVRYAESDGYRQDAYRRDAWRYRDYVVASFNQDKPYDRFIAEQLAGDEIDPDDLELRAATGYLRLWIYEFNQRDVPGQWDTIQNDLTDVTADVFLGLGLGCARCHDHKFDPLLQDDYFRLRAFFAPLMPRDDLPLATDDDRADWHVRNAAWELMTADVRAELDAFEKPHRDKAFAVALAKFQPDLQAIIVKPDAERTPSEKQLAYLAGRQFVEEFGKIDGTIKGDDKTLWEGLKKRLAAFDPYRPDPLPTTLVATDLGPVAPPTTIPGEPSARPIEPGFLTILDEATAEIAPVPGSTGRRLALARWLTRPDNPLTARVIVNRVWQYHVGRGIVGTTSDFGTLGDRPSHPELLDWLASEFVSREWSLKGLHRLIVTSATYRQSSLRPMPEVARLKDPGNLWLWRMNTRRLDVEPIRDAMLCVSGELRRMLGGPSVDATVPRRALVTKVIRNTRDPLSDAFDGPDGTLSTPRRDVTTTPMQSLLMINGPWPLARAKGFAARLRRDESDPSRRVDRAYRLAFGRPPTDDERADALSFLGSQALRAEDVAAAWEDFCHALINSNEFLYVD